MIANKLGVHFNSQKGGYNKQPQQEGFFNKKARENSSNYSTSTLEDIMV
jgi:hypothetical protein